ncbi:hypothetical protein [Pseudogulbenkiania subflava]|uniref:hypothetical protein n=1 Tax=Pseudogulbenkiania subflava TaxID=451637 RepID=UPI00389A172D
MRHYLECSKDRFQCSLNSNKSDSEGNPIILEKKLLVLFPEKHIKAYHHAANNKHLSDLTETQNEWLARAHLVVDFLAGMTDDYSIELYRTLSGIKTL